MVNSRVVEGLQETTYEEEHFHLPLHCSQRTLPHWGHWLETSTAIAVHLPPNHITINLDVPWTLISTRFKRGTGMAAFNSDRFLSYCAEPSGFDVIPQGSTYRSIESTGPCIVLALKQSLAEHFHWPDLDWSITPGQVPPSARGQAIGQALQTFFYDRVGGALHLESLVTLALHHVSRHRASLKRPQLPDRLTPHQLRQVIAFIQDSLEQPLTLKQISQVINISAYHFAHAFKGTTGLSPHRYVLQCRLARAQQRLRNSDEDIAAISYAVGFGSQSHMTTVFRKFLNTTPAVYRRQFQGARV